MKWLIYTSSEICQRKSMALKGGSIAFRVQRGPGKDTGDGMAGLPSVRLWPVRVKWNGLFWNHARKHSPGFEKICFRTRI